MSRPSRSCLIQSLLALAALALLALAVYQNRGEIREVFAREIDAGGFALGFAVYLAALVLTFVRWFVLVRALGLPFRVADALNLGFIGNVYNLVIPGAVGGDLIKGAFLVRMMEARKAQSVASMVIDRLVGLLGLFVLASIGGAFAWSGSGGDVRTLIALAWAAAVAGPIGLAVLFTPALYRPLLALLKGRRRVAAILEELVGAAGIYRSKLPVVLGALGMATTSHALFVLAFFLVDRALFGAEAPGIGAHYVVVPLAIFSTSVPLPFGALGLSEQVADYLFAQVGHGGGAVAMMGFRVLMYAGGLISVLVYLANLRRVRRLEAAVKQGEFGGPVP